MTDATTLPAPAHTDYPTMPHLSRARAEALTWYCQVLSQATPADQDAARFLQGFSK
jgi:hypothetical protein